jgi:NAD(P)H dehydrogenase (quinone)
MYLVTGASGKFGRIVLDTLLSTHNVPASRIIATTRKPETLAAYAAKGVVVREADFEKPEGLAAAFAGAGRLLLISTDTLDRPGARLAQHRNAVKAAEQAGVRHILYTSLPDVETSALLFAPDHLGTEQAIAASSIPGWTILRNNWYFENLFYSLPSAIASGSLYSSAGDGKIAHVARADLARAAAAALAGSESGRVTLTLSGEKVYTMAEIAALVSKAVSKPISLVEVSDEALTGGLVAAGFPEPVARAFASFDTNIRQGGLSKVTGDVRQLTGHAPQSFEDWLAANASAFLK